MNKQNLQNLADLPPERRREIARMGGRASAAERARQSEIKAAVRYALLKMEYLDAADEELKAEWREFQRWRKRQKKHRTPRK